MEVYDPLEKSGGDGNNTTKVQKMIIMRSQRLFTEGGVGFNPVQKLPAYEFLNKENKQCESITHKTHMHRDFSLDPKIGTTSLIFHYVPFNVTIHIYTCRSIQYHGPKNHRVQYHVRKSCTKP